MWSLPKHLKSSGLYELDRQSQTRRQGCHCWELQDELFAFCERIGIACVDLLNRVFSTHFIGFLLRATKKERKWALKRLRYYVLPKAMFLGQTPKAVFPASERKYTAAGGDVQVPWGVIHEWQKSEKMDWYTDWWSKRSPAWALLLPVDQTGFQTTQSFQFLNRSLFRCSPVVMNLRWRLKKYCQ